MISAFLILLACAHCDMNIFQQETTKNAVWIKKHQPHELLSNSRAFKRVIADFYDRYRYFDIDVVVAKQASDFLFGAALARELNVPFIFLESQALQKNQRVLFIENIITQSHSLKKTCELIEAAGAKIIEVGCIIEGPHVRHHLNQHLFSLLAQDS